MPALPSTPAGLQGARSDARALCRRHAVDPGRGDDFVLVVSELISNAIVHGRPPSDYDVSLDEGDLLVTVDDADPKGLPSRKPGTDQAESGRGLVIVETLSRIWGWLPTATGKRVWARV